MKYLALGIALALSAAAFAYPTISGPSGGFMVPTAEVQQGWAIAVDRTEGTGPEIPLISVLAGLTSNLEVGAQYVDFGPDDAWAVNAKFALPFDLIGGGLAIGAIYADGPWDAYLAGTWTVLDDVALTAAAIYSDFDDGTDDVSFAVAAEKSFENAAIGAEVLFSQEGVDTFGNLYVKYALSEQLKLRLAWTGIGNATGFTLGAAYFFGQ